MNHDFLHVSQMRGLLSVFSPLQAYTCAIQVSIAVRRVLSTFIEGSVIWADNF